mgnify:CR=1 FL=1
MVDKTTTDNTLEIAKRFTNKVYGFTHDPVFLEIRRQSLLRCTGDWVLWIDDDEPLSPHWTRSRVQELMGKRTVTHYWVPSRQLVTDSGLYISTWPHVGHFNMRLYRNIESIAVLPKKTHDSMAIAGEPAYVAGMYSDSRDFIWHSREVREAKVRAYDDSNPAIDNARFYLYEDYYFETRPVNNSLDPAVMAPIENGRESSGVAVRFMDVQPRMTVGQSYWVVVRIVNNSGRALLPQSEFIRWGTLAVTYRWLSPNAKPEIEPAIQSPFPARILPGHQHDTLVRIKTPGNPGAYRLQIQILENGEPLEDLNEDPRAEQTIDVTPLVWPPRIHGKETRAG